MTEQELLDTLNAQSRFITIELPPPVNKIVLGFVICQDDAKIIFESYIAHTDSSDSFVCYKRPDYYFMDAEKNSSNEIVSQFTISIKNTYGQRLRKYIADILIAEGVSGADWKNYQITRKFKTLSFEDFKNQYSVNEDFFNVIARNTNFDKLKEFIEAHKIIKNTIEIIPIVITEDDLKKIDNVE